MVNLVYGNKGSGKTKKIIAKACEAAKNPKEYAVFITDNSIHTLDVPNSVRYVNIAEYSVKTEDAFTGFLQGMIAANRDITQIFIDGINRFLTPPDNMQNLMQAMEKMSAFYNVNFCVTVSAEVLPDYLKRYN